MFRPTLIGNTLVQPLSRPGPVRSPALTNEEFHIAREVHYELCFLNEHGRVQTNGDFRVEFWEWSAQGLNMLVLHSTHLDETRRLIEMNGGRVETLVTRLSLGESVVTE